MGCGNAREKIENEIMEIKIARIELQMERYNQLEKLKGIDGNKINNPLIPDYIDQKFLKDYLKKKSINISLNSNEEGKKRKKSKRSKSLYKNAKMSSMRIEAQEKSNTKKENTCKGKL